MGSNCLIWAPYPSLPTERDSSGLCCPLELTPLLRSSFKKTDEQLLQYLHGDRRGMPGDLGSLYCQRRQKDRWGGSMPLASPL